MAERLAANAPLVLRLEALGRAALPLAGGKGANLGELARADLAVPPGFCLATAAYARVAAGADLEPLLAELADTSAADVDRLRDLAATMRARLLAAPVPAEVAAAVAEAYRALGDGLAVPVAVRSSATAEDLPEASFAGQQETFLHVVGADAVVNAVRRCWASLWTDRAVAYRAGNGVDHRAVLLAVVVQRMVDSELAGVLFTADPVSGRRRRAVIDASPGLGEAIVSGVVNPDHFVVDTASGYVLERHLGDKRVAIRGTAGGGTERAELAADAGPCLSDEQLRELAHLGARVEGLFDAPQDVEWAIGPLAGADGDSDAGGSTTWLTQARPITTLYPLPASAPAGDEDLRIYFSVNVAQGVFRPFTPMGVQGFRLLAASLAGAAGHRVRDRLAGPDHLVEAGGRLFADLTPFWRNSFLRGRLLALLPIVEARTAAIFRRLADDPRLAPKARRSWRQTTALLRLLSKKGIQVGLLRVLLRPDQARQRAWHAARQLDQLAGLPPNAGARQRLETVERLFTGGASLIAGRFIPLLVGGLGSHALAGKLLGPLATPDERQRVLRALPHNPTTEMDLSLWALAQRVRSDEAAARLVLETAPETLAAAYHREALPPILQAGLAAFLGTYGHRAIAEIDLGLPRWSEDPAHLLGVLANYLRLDDPALAPDAQFRRAAAEAEATVAELSRRVARRGRWRGALVRFLLSRARALAGQREAPKFNIVRLLALARGLLWPVGEELAAAGRLDAAEDIFFLDLAEARAALAGADQRALVRERRATYRRELRRRHVPRVLLSDGTEPSPEPTAAPADGALRGSPASAGLVTARARVVLDPTGAHIEPGEVLVAPSTDPGWTPLFLTAGGLVMEMGGPMSHGAVVAREYGIPAVVGVPGATERIRTGQLVTVDGSAGRVTLA